MPIKAPSIPTANGRAIVATILVGIILLPVVCSVISSVIAAGAESSEGLYEPPDPDRVGKVSPDGYGCVKDTEYMRYHHWELLRGLREDVVRYGRRGDITLNGCWKCHESKSHFCDKCHNAASVILDCFGCHNDRDLEESLR